MTYKLERVFIILLKSSPKFYRHFRVMGHRILKIPAYDSCPSIIQLDINLGPVMKEFCRCNWSLKAGDLMYKDYWGGPDSIRWKTTESRDFLQMAAEETIKEIQT